VALDIATFKTRALSAVVFAAVMLFGLLAGKLPFFILFSAITFIAAKEYYFICHKIIGKSDDEMVMHTYCIAMLALYFFVANSGNSVFIDNALLTIKFYTIPILVLTLFWLGMTKGVAPSYRMMLGYFYIPLSFGLLAQLYMMNSYIPLALLVLIWINDTMQYIVGSMFGKHKMAPITSPKKTWEGTIGGSLICVLFALICGYFIKSIPYSLWLAMGFSASIMGTLGDLLESKLKRSAQIKDSGNIMPGHGGALDRMDSLLLAGPVLWILVQFLNHFVL
jgi:phosphatidate cytidylyltransferase